jgi:hypothetical protein
MWTRPDRVVYIAAFVVAALAFPREPRKVIATSVLKGGAVCAAVYLPWFAWAWWYYGSPIPHTVIAKSHTSGGRAPLDVEVEVLRRTLRARRDLRRQAKAATPSLDPGQELPRIRLQLHSLQGRSYSFTTMMYLSGP